MDSGCLAKKIKRAPAVYMVERRRAERAPERRRSLALATVGAFMRALLWLFFFKHGTRGELTLPLPAF